MGSHFHGLWDTSCHGGVWSASGDGGIFKRGRAVSGAYAGGDRTVFSKLAALICGYSGLTAGAAAIGLGFLIGAFWSFLKMMVKGSFHERFDHLTAYIRRIYHTKKITAYYDFARDGAEAVIPLGVCLLFGTMAFIMIPG